MITSAKNYTKKKWTDRTLGQMVKANVYRQNHKKRKRKIYIHLYIQKIIKEESNQINRQINSKY